MRSILILLFLVGLAVPAQAKDVWSRSNGRVTLDAARISVPDKAGALPLKETKEFSHQGESLDAVAQYESSDGKIFATVYVYHPGIAHSGLSALATDAAIRLRSRDHPLRTQGSQVVAAGGMSGVAVRTDYDNFLGAMVSSAAFIKAGRWMVKFRVSGPQRRADEVQSAMSDLLARVRFEGSATPLPAALISPESCPDVRGGDAALVADDPAANAALAVVIAAFDAAAPSATDADTRKENSLPSRIGGQWCRSVVEAGTSQVPLLRATDPATDLAIEGKSMLFALYSDAGGLLEVVRLRKEGRYLLLNHQIGATSLLGTYTAMPSDRQIIEILTGQGDGGRVRARVNLKSDGKTDVQVEAPPASPTA